MKSLRNNNEIRKMVNWDMSEFKHEKNTNKSSDDAANVEALLEERGFPHYLFPQVQRLSWSLTFLMK